MRPRISMFRMDLPLCRAIPVKGQEAVARTILRLLEEDEEGVRWTADCSPLAGFHQESIDESFESARRYFSSPAPPAGGDLPISLKTSLEILRWQKLLPKPRPIAGSFENTALLKVPPRSEYEAVFAAVAAARVCKVKIGAHDLKLCRTFLIELCAQRPDRELRIDFNQTLGLSDIKAVTALLKGLPIAYIEEPCSPIKDLKIFARALPLALDESLGLDAELDRIAKAWVIKPNRVGWWQSLARFSDEGPQQKILSNVFESLETLQLYAWAYRQAVVKAEACGLGTAFYMADEVPEGAWNPKTYRGVWPSHPIAVSVKTEGDLVWQN